jgi:hypothetical protein
MSVIDELVLGRGLTEELAREVERWGERLRARTVEAGVEFAVSLDAETATPIGPPLGGTAVQVDIDDDVRLMQRDRRYVTLHTHPASSAFSDLDVSTFIGVAMLMVMVVVGADGRCYVLSKPKDAHLPEPVEAAQRLRAEVIRLMPWYRAQVQARRLEPREAWRAHSHAAWLAVAPELGLRYSRVEPSKEES